MHRIHTLLTVILGLALILSLVVLRKTRRELQQQLQTLTDANSALRETLGDLTIEIARNQPCRPPTYKRMRAYTRKY